MEPHGFGEGCRCNGCVWEEVCLYRPLIGSIANQASRKNPWIIQDFHDLYAYLVSEAFIALKSHRPGPIGPGQSQSTASRLRLCLTQRCNRYIMQRFRDNRRITLSTTQYLNADGTIGEGDEATDIPGQGEEDRGYEEVERRWEGRVMLDWLKENFIRGVGRLRADREAAFLRLTKRLEGQTLDQIAKGENVSKQAVSESISKVLKYARAHAPQVIGREVGPIRDIRAGVEDDSG